jgi:hypothetical protein
MKSQRSIQTKSIFTYYRKSLKTKRGWRFATIFVLLTAAASIAVTALTFAQNPLKTSRAESPAAPATRTAEPRKSAPTGKRSSKAKGRRNSAQDQELVARAQDERGERERRERGPREWRLRRARRSFTGDLRELPQTRPVKSERIEREGPEPNPGVFVPPGESAESVSKESSAPSAPLAGPNAPAPPPAANFEGLDFNTWGNGHPPDTNGDVGPNHYIQSINTSVGIFNKTTGGLITAFTFNTFMSQGNFGNLCDTNNFGDPVVLYDTF